MKVRYVNVELERRGGRVYPLRQLHFSYLYFGADRFVTN